MAKIKVDPVVERAFPRYALISHNVIALREVYGIAVDEMCLALGMSAPTYNARIRDPRLWSVGDLHRIASKFGISFDELVNYDFTRKGERKNGKRKVVCDRDPG